MSDLIGLVAASLPDGTRVLAPDIDFASVLFPFMAQAHRGVTMRLVAARGHRRTRSTRARTSSPFSAVQMATGEVADLDAIAEAAAAHGAMTVVDATQAVRLAAARRVALRRRRLPRLQVADVAARHRVHDRAARAPGRRSCRPPRAGSPARTCTPRTSARRCACAETARRLDSSPAWFSWVGTQPALALVNAIGVEAIHAHDVGLANRFRAGLGLEPSDSAIVSADVPGARERLEAAGIVAAERGGRLRASWHVYNTEADVDAALDALAGA